MGSRGCYDYKNLNPNYEMRADRDMTARAVEQLVDEVDALGLDLTATYDSWLRAGFALASEMGEDGRGLFHRLSRHYPKYRQREADKQYDQCLKGRGSGVTIATLFGMAKDAGVDIARIKGEPGKGCERQSGNGYDTSNDQKRDLEEPGAFARELAESLPPFLRKIVGLANSDDDADLLLLGSIVTLSACMPHVYGIYGYERVSANLYLFVAAPASSGKGRLSLCRRLVEPIHRELKAESEQEWKEYKRRMKKYMASQNKEELDAPEEPPQRMLIIPANASATSMFQILSENNESGLIFETEGDTLAQTFKSEHGNYSDGFRKAFHHEPISYVRRKNREHVEVKSPRLSAVLSGTPRQIKTLIQDAENGLFSRFMFFTMKLKLVWLDVFAEHKDGSLDMQFDGMAMKFLKLYHFLQQCQDMKFEMTSEQKASFDMEFKALQAYYNELLGEAFVASVRRLGLIVFRVAMVLTVIRMTEGAAYATRIVCADDDFVTATRIGKAMVKHAALVFCELSGQPIKVRCKMGREILDEVDMEFTRQEFLDAAEKLGVKRDTARRYVDQLTANGDVERTERGRYRKM